MRLDHSEARLLLIESHPGLREDLVSALSRAGFHVEAFADAEEAGAFGRSGARPALQMVDPTALGAEAWLEGNEGDRIDSVPTLVLANRSDEKSESLGWGAEGHSILYKPFSIHALERRIAEIVGAERSKGERPLDSMLDTRDPALVATLSRARKWAARSFSICIEGEIGTGRRALARAIHSWGSSGRRSCAVVERSLIESTAASQLGTLLAEALESARHGSVLLVEPDEWPAYAQEALVESLRSVEREGAPRCLVIAKQALLQSVREGRLTVELQYRLDAAGLSLPPIRERVEDHPALCSAIARRVSRELGMRSPTFRPEWVEALAAEGFPGNRLGLESRLRSALVRAGEDGDLLAALQGSASSSPSQRNELGAESLNLKTLERETIIRALAHWEGNRTRASETLGISVRTLRNKIREYELR